jgi:two-component system, sensor histidine kinase and response regulator
MRQNRRWMGGASVRKKRSTKPPARAARWCVLLVDDNADNREMYAEYLTMCGLDVELAASAEEAFARLEAKTPSLIVMDIGLPKLDGIEATRLIKVDPRYADTPIVILSAHTEPSFATRAIAAGANAFCSKPCTPLELLQKIVELLPPVDGPRVPPTTGTRPRFTKREREPGTENEG